MPRNSEPIAPGLDDLPEHVSLVGRRLGLRDVNITQARAYLKILRRREREAIEATKLHRRIVQLEALLALMEKHAAKMRGITAGEVAELERK